MTYLDGASIAVDLASERGAKMAAPTVSSVKAFVSYSWSSESHEQWVIDLAERLAQDGIHVVLDKWDLKVGHDANAFMEAMVTDPAVTKVLMVCDRVYTDKANGRAGGVGKEAQILTAEIYEKAAQDKYAAIITERDENGKPFVPAYYGGRQYIDFTVPERRESAYHELLRWIYDRPKHVRPKLGAAPSFIIEPEAVTTATTSKFKSADHAIRTGSPIAGGLITDFGEDMISEWRSLKPNFVDNEDRDETVIKAAEAMRPALRHLTELSLDEIRFKGGNTKILITILEKMGSLMYRQPDDTSWGDADWFDPYRMMCYEGFLSIVAILIAEQNFDLLHTLLSHPYLIEGRERNQGPATTTYRVFAQDIPSFELRKRRLASNQKDLYSDLIAQTYKASFPLLDQIIQADLLLYLHGAIIQEGGSWEQWWPRTLIYANRHSSTELFSRSESLKFFKNWAPKVFGDISVEAFKARVTKLEEQARQAFGFMPPSVVMLANVKHLGGRA